MQIVKDWTTFDVSYRVYPAEPHNSNELQRLVRALRETGIPFLIGGSELDPNLLLRIGPVGALDEQAFDREWATYFVVPAAKADGSAL